MSAICGLFHRSGAPIEPAHLAPMMTALDAYGLDGQHTWQQDNIGFGHCMLHVTPESLYETLPYTASAPGLTITADARLDNREELCATLSIPHTERAQITDSQLILYAYQKWGTDCPIHLLGDFAFAIWDSRERHLFCARDHIGARPLYYSLSPQCCVFASNMNAMLTSPEVSEQLNEAYVAARLQDRFFVHPHYTFYEAIRSLPPGHTLSVRPEQDELARYWFPEHVTEDHYASDAERQEVFLELYTQAVQARLRTAYPIGVHLSGGLDSSSVAVLTARALREQGRPAPPAFCWQAPPNNACLLGREHTLIQAVCDQEGLTPTYQTLTAEDTITGLQHDLTRIPGVSDSDHERIVQHQAASQGIRVLLSGWGGDEGMTFPGRGYYAELLWRGQWGQLYTDSQAASMNWKGLAGQALVPFFPAPVQQLVERWRQSRRGPKGKSYIHPDFARRVQPLTQKRLRMTGVHTAQLQLVARGHITQRIDAWTETGAQHHLVYSYPLLDRHVLEFALGMPIDQFRHGPWGRWFMRRALERVLPIEVCWNREQEEPERVHHLRSALRPALLAVGHRLTSRPTLPSRAGYVDMPRLMSALKSQALESPGYSRGFLRTALYFLDF